MRSGTFKFCMLFAGAALLAVAVYYFITYIGVKIALDNNGLKPFFQQTIRALWLTFSCQALLISLLYLVVAYRPQSATREVIVIFGLMQLVESVLMLAFSGSWIAAALLGLAAICVLIGSVAWPTREMVTAARSGVAASNSVKPSGSAPSDQVL